MRAYAALPHEYLEEMAPLTDEEFGRLIRGLLRYSMTGEPIQAIGNEKFYTARVMGREDRYRNSYDDLAQRLSEAGKRGAAKRWGKSGDGLPMAPNGLDGNTKTEPKTKPDPYAPRPGGRRSRAAQAAMEERLKKDMEELARLTQRGCLE